MTHELTRDELHELVWSEPIVRLCARFSVSGVALAKACGRAAVPVPPRGWWAKKAAGKPASARPSLGPRPPGLSNTVVIGGSPYDRYYCRSSDQEVLENPLPPAPVFEEPIEAVRDRIGVMVGAVTVPQSLTRVHPLVARLLAQDEERRAREKGRPFVSLWDAPKFDTPLERRRLRILSAIFFALARCGCSVDGRRHEGQVFGVQVGHQHILLASAVEEKRRRVAGAKPGSEPKVERWLRLRLGVSHDGTGEGARSWQDGSQPLERYAREIVVETILLGEVQYRENVFSHHRWLAERKAQLEEAARRARAEAERKERERQALLAQERVDRLLREARALAQAREIRRYVDEVQAANTAAADPLPPEEINAWSAWALEQADRIDPVRSGAFKRDLFLRGDDRSR